MLMNLTDWPTQAMVDKFCKNKTWQVMTARYDFESNKIVARIMLNANISEVREAGYDEICKMFGWKSYEFSPDFLYVFPQPDVDGFFNAPGVKRVEYDADGNPILKRKRRMKKQEK